MRRRFASAICLVMVAASASLAAPASAAPSNVCYGEVAGGIASTWPWAHEGQQAFPPPPGGLALWVEIFGPQVGVSSSRELQLLFCS